MGSTDKVRINPEDERKAMVLPFTFNGDHRNMFRHLVRTAWFAVRDVDPSLSDEGEERMEELANAVDRIMNEFGWSDVDFTRETEEACVERYYMGRR